MKTEYRLAETLKEMMKTTSLEKISVVELTKKCNVYRQTFYYYYHDIYDLLTVVFLIEKIDGIEQVSSTKALLTTIFDYYSKNAKFIDASINSSGKDLVNEFLYNNCYQTFLRLITKSRYAEQLTIKERKDVARFYASAFASSIIYYLLTSKNKTINNFLKSIVFADDELMVNSIKKIIKSHIKK